MAWRPLYVDSDDLAVYCSRPQSDPDMPIIAEAASRAVDGACGRQFGQMTTATVRTYNGCDAFALKGRYLLPIDDIQDTTGVVVTVAGAAVAAGVDGYRFYPRNAVADGFAYTHVDLAAAPTGDVDIAAKFGWTAFPAAAVLAAKLQGSRWAIRRESPYGVAGSPADGSTQTLTARLDPDLRGSLKAAGLVRMAAVG